MVLILGVLAVVEWLWRRPVGAERVVAVIVEVRGRPYRIASVGQAPQVLAAVVVLAAFATTTGYIRIARNMLPLWPNYTARVEYRITDWLWKNMPDARVFPSGSVRFWFDAWHDLAQLGGGSEQGLLNTATQRRNGRSWRGTIPKPPFSGCRPWAWM